MSNRAKEAGLMKLADGVTVDLTQAADTETVLYTCPAGKQCLIFATMAYNFDEAVDEAVVTLGKGGGNCDEFLGNQTLTNITAGFADECLILQPIPNATPVAALVLDAGETFSVEITTPETTGAATCKMMPIGIEITV